MLYRGSRCITLATLVVVSADPPLSIEGRIVWAMLEPHSKGRPLRYRAGSAFTSADEAAIETFISNQPAAS